LDKSNFNNKKEWRKFGTGLSLIMAAIGILQVIYSHERGWYILGAAATVFLVSWIVPVILKPVFILFSYIGFIMGWVMTRVILTVLFYLVLTPVGLIAKLSGKSFLPMELNKSGQSYWVDISGERKEHVTYERQF